MTTALRRLLSSLCFFLLLGAAMPDACNPCPSKDGGTCSSCIEERLSNSGAPRDDAGCKAECARTSRCACTEAHYRENGSYRYCDCSTCSDAPPADADTPSDPRNGCGPSGCAYNGDALRCCGTNMKVLAASAKDHPQCVNPLSGTGSYCAPDSPKTCPTSISELRVARAAAAAGDSCGCPDGSTPFTTSTGDQICPCTSTLTENCVRTQCYEDSPGVAGAGVLDMCQYGHFPGGFDSTTNYVGTCEGFCAGKSFMCVAAGGCRDIPDIGKVAAGGISDGSFMSKPSDDVLCVCGA